MTKLLVASNNPKKLKELREQIDSAGITGLTLLSLDDVISYPEPVESGATFKDNALIKAQAGAQATGIACLADDSGICVQALNDMPGVLSARWAGVTGKERDEANNRLLLRQLADIPTERRRAYFISVCTLVIPKDTGDASTEAVSEGRWTGSITTEPHGEGGFGYDPIFAPDGFSGKVVAQLTVEEKNSASHRAQALKNLIPELAQMVV